MHTAIYSVYYQNKNTYNVNILVIADAISLVLARKSPFLPVKKNKKITLTIAYFSELYNWTWRKQRTISFERRRKLTTLWMSSSAFESVLLEEKPEELCSLSANLMCKASNLSCSILFCKNIKINNEKTRNCWFIFDASYASYCMQNKFICVYMLGGATNAWHVKQMDKVLNKEIAYKTTDLSLQI